MFYYLYEIKNKLNGKIYVGVHKTKDIDDGYMGSGKVILSAIKKYGIENFEKKILATFDNAEDMFNAEKDLVTEDFLSRNDVYNIRRGRYGGFDYINRNNLGKRGFTDDERKKAVDSIRAMDRQIFVEAAKEVAKKRPIEERKRIANIAAIAAQSPDVVLKRNKTRDQNCFQQGEKNSQYGTRWAWVVKENEKPLKIRLDDLTAYLDKGYKRGIKL